MIYRFEKPDTGFWVEYCRFADSGNQFYGRGQCNNYDLEWRLCAKQDIEIIRRENITLGWVEVKINPIPKRGCDHEFVDYIGFIEQFTYCRKCDVRK